MEKLVYVDFLGLDLEFSNVAFSIFGYNVYWYGIIIATGFMAALVYAFIRAKDFDINSDLMVDAVIAGALGAIICARAYYVLNSLDSYSSFAEMLDIRDGGLAIYGAVIGAFVFGGLMCKIRKINVLSMFDLAGIGFLIGQAVGRWGNFVNQEAFGTNTALPWGMWSGDTYKYLSEQKSVLAQQGITVDPMSPVHPCFLYESLWCLIGFVLLHFYSKHRRFKGEIFLAYIIWYGLGRFFIEGLRTDSLMIGSVRISQVLAAVCFVAGTVLLVALRIKFKPVTAEEMAYSGIIGGEDDVSSQDSGESDGPATEDDPAAFENAEDIETKDEENGEDN